MLKLIIEFFDKLAVYKRASILAEAGDIEAARALMLDQYNKHISEKREHTAPFFYDCS